MRFLLFYDLTVNEPLIYGGSSTISYGYCVRGANGVTIDSQSIKLAPMIWENRGTEANKRVNGRKRPFVVDTQGRLWLISDLLWLAGERSEKVYGDQSASAVRLQWCFRPRVS
jgi:hypothetical protein